MMDQFILYFIRAARMCFLILTVLSALALWLLICRPALLLGALRIALGALCFLISLASLFALLQSLKLQ